jgi:lysophospholipase L1-like esterase
MSNAMISTRPTAGPTSALIACVAATNVDLWPALSDGRGGLRAEFTPDKLHLNGLGYAEWVDTLSPITRQALQ